MRSAFWIGFVDGCEMIVLPFLAVARWLGLPVPPRHV
jgi:hypothetical protein